MKAGSTSRTPVTKASSGRTPTTVTKETSDYVSPVETFDPRLTHSGARLGTGAYMAPEQTIDPKTVDVRADIYGFGVVLYEMITGELPFKGKSAEALAHQHSFHKAPSVIPSIVGRYVKFAKPVDAIVQRCLKKDLGERFHTVAELRQSSEAGHLAAPEEVSSSLIFGMRDHRRPVTRESTNRHGRREPIRLRFPSRSVDSAVNLFVSRDRNRRWPGRTGINRRGDRPGRGHEACRRRTRDTRRMSRSRYGCSPTSSRSRKRASPTTRRESSDSY